MTTNDKNSAPGAGDGDRELMRHLDDELEPELAREIERRLAEDETARDKRAGLLFVGALLRERVDADRRGDGIADAVMARLDEAAALPPLDDEPAPLDDEPAPIDQPAPIDEILRTPKPAIEAAPANDNARIIFTLAAAAAAVAGVLFFWGNSEPVDTVAIAPAPEAPLVESEVPAPAPPKAPQAEAEVEEAAAPVEVAAVDFGSQSGSVFYVSGQNAATAVVWVTGGEEP